MDSHSPNFLRTSYELLTNFLRTSYELLTNFLQTSYNFLTNFLQTSYELLMNFLQTSYKLLKTSYKFLMNFIWTSYELLTIILKTNVSFSWTRSWHYQFVAFAYKKYLKTILRKSCEFPLSSWSDVWETLPNCCRTKEAEVEEIASLGRRETGLEVCAR